MTSTHHTQDTVNTSEARSRRARRLIAMAAAGTLAAGTVLFVPALSDNDTAASTRIAEGGQPSAGAVARWGSADAAEHWLKAERAQTFGSADAAERWLGPDAPVRMPRLR